MLPDHRIRFPSARIDFDTDVGGNEGQAHDTYPAAGQQLRYDWQRLFLIGLLTNQSSYSAPTQYRDGTIWFDLNEECLKIRLGGAWKKLAEVISLTGSGSPTDITTLAEWYESVSTFLQTFAPEITFSGTCTIDDSILITIPESLRGTLNSSSRPFVYINGILVDPRNCQIVTGTSIQLSNTSLAAADAFTVIIRNILPAYYYSQTVTVP